MQFVNRVNHLVKVLVLDRPLAVHFTREVTVLTTAVPTRLLMQHLTLAVVS